MMTLRIMNNNIMRRLRQLVAQSWHTDEIRKIRPTPIDEAKWGFAVVENSLWEGVPAFLREFNEQLEDSIGAVLPVEANPIRFTSWMGGDRDGNQRNCGCDSPSSIAESLESGRLIPQRYSSIGFRTFDDGSDPRAACASWGMTLTSLSPNRENLRSQLFSTLEYLERRVKASKFYHRQTYWWIMLNYGTRYTRATNH